MSLVSMLTAYALHNIPAEDSDDPIFLDMFTVLLEVWGAMVEVDERVRFPRRITTFERGRAHVGGRSTAARC